MFLKTRLETDAPVEQLYQLALREGNAKKPVYEMHKWWARRLGSVFRMLILLATAPETQSDEELWRRFYEGDDLSTLRLLDPFMGGGTAVVEATKLQCQTVGIDIDPVAWFVTRQEISPCDLHRFEEAVEQLRKSDLASRIRSLYQTRVLLPTITFPPETGLADVIYNFWVDVLCCPRCSATFEAHPHYKLRYSKSAQTVFCKTCHQAAVIPNDTTTFTCEQCGTKTPVDQGPIDQGNYTCPNCSAHGRIVDLIHAGSPLPKRWFAIEYLEPGTHQRLFKGPDAQDHEQYFQAERLLAEEISRLPLPKRAIPLEGRADPRPTTHGYDTYQQLFNSRQLLALGWLLEWIQGITDDEVRNYFLLAFSDALAANNMLCAFAYGYDKLTPLFGLHAYNMIARPVENNVWGTVYGRGSFLNCLNKVRLGKQYCASPYESRYRPKSGALQKIYGPTPIAAKLATAADDWYQTPPMEGLPRTLLLNQDSQRLAGLHDQSIHLILSDPPYYNNLSYSELSDFYYAWTQPFLQQAGSTWKASSTPYAEALFVTPRGNVQQSVERFTRGLKQVFRECQRVLHDQGLMVFTYHHLDSTAWVPLIQALLDANLEVTHVFPVRSEGQGAFHSTVGTVKWDAVIACRKKIGQHLVSSVMGGEVKEVLFAWVTASVKQWQQRLAASEIPFAWPDAVSLSYAFAAQYLTRGTSNLQGDIDVLLAALQQQIIATLPIPAQQQIRKRKKRSSHRLLVGTQKMSE